MYTYTIYNPPYKYLQKPEIRFYIHNKKYFNNRKNGLFTDVYKDIVYKD